MRILTMTCLFLGSFFGFHANAEWAEQMPVGSSFPPITATDQHGNTWTPENMSGEKGMVFFFNRSTSW